MVTVKVNNVEVEMVVDTGASTDIIDSRSNSAILSNNSRQPDNIIVCLWFK